MAITTNLGYRLPETTDDPSVIVQIMQENFKRLATHAHQGVDSPHMDASALENRVDAYENMESASSTVKWSARDLSTGLFSVTIDVDNTSPDKSPVSLLTNVPVFYEAPSGGSRERVYLDYEITSATRMVVKSNVNFSRMEVQYT